MDATATEPHKCRLTVQIDAAVDEHAFEAPSFRFRFLEGSKKQTPVIGVSGWTSLSVPESDGDKAPTSHQGLLQPPANTFRFEQVFPDVSVTEALATSLDDDPVLSFFFSDHAGLAGSAAAASSSAPAKDAKSAAKGVPAPASGSLPGAPAANDTTGSEPRTPKTYAGIYDLDVSSLLAGELQLEQVWTSGAVDEPDKPDAVVSPFGNNKAKKSKENLTSTPSQSLFSLLPKTSGGLRYLAIRISLNQPLLSPALMKKLNPLTITLSSARQLPGVTSTSSTRDGLKTPHAPLVQHCRPVYALLQFFPDRLRTPGTGIGANGASQPIPRILATQGKPQQENVDWDQRVTFLSSRFDRAELIDALQYATFTVELHDRDLPQSDKLRRLVAKWEALHTTGVDTTVSANSSPGLGQGPLPASDSRTTTPRTVSAQQQQQQTPKPMEIFAVDEVAKRDCRLLITRSGEFFPHGIATFRLSELLNSARQLVGGTKAQQPEENGTKPFLSRLKLSSDVVSVKRRAKPLGAGVSDDDDDPFAVFDLTPLEKLVREPGAYLASGTTLSVHVSLQHPLVQAQSVNTSSLSASSSIAEDNQTPVPPQGLFSRMVLIIPYKDDAALDQVARVMTTVNLAALPGIPIRSYQMSESEQRACENGDLDVITGTQVIDAHFRTIFLEGLADKGMKKVHELVPRRQQPNDPHGYRLSANDQLRFTTRLYTAFQVLDLKRIKLRYPLPLLLNAPDIYMRSKVSESCFKALTRLVDVRNATRLEEIKNLDLFPTAHMLLEVESKYGESITLEDIHGRGGGLGSGGKPSSSHKALYADVPAAIEASPETLSGPGEKSPGDETKSSSKRHSITMKAPTDSTNDRFEQLRRSRKDKDFLSERKKESDLIQSEYSEKKKLLDAQMQDQQQQQQQPVYMYSGQKLRTQDALQDEMRRQLAKDHHATYTYSADFQSLAVSLVDPDALRRTEELFERKKWTTQRGFVYPPPRQSNEYYKHKDVPSEARCEDLRAPFVDNVNHPKPVSREVPGSDGSGSRRGGSLPEFSTLPSKDMVFGGTNGDGTVNTEFFKSVHLCGDGLRQEQEEALKRELLDWERRLVVDKKQIKFLAHGNITGLPRKKPAQLDKITDILAGPARSKPIRIVKNATLPSGKRVPLEAPPVTIHNQQEYAGCVAEQFATTLRETDTSQFVGGAHEKTGRPKDFLFPSMTQVLTPPVKKHVSRKEIAPVRVEEKRGLFWRNE